MHHVASVADKIRNYLNIESSSYLPQMLLNSAVILLCILCVHLNKYTIPPRREMQSLRSHGNQSLGEVLEITKQSMSFLLLLFGLNVLVSALDVRL